MTAAYRVRLGIVAGLFLLLSGAAPADASPGRAAPSIPGHVIRVQAPANLNTQAQIYLLRGLANVFSRGMDEMGARLTSYGFSPHVLNHRGWQNAADTIVRNYRRGQTAPVILIGHSLGANAAFRIAKRLQSKGVPVAYLATFDPTRTFTVPNNVRVFANFYQNNGQGRRASFSSTRHEDKVNLNLTSSPGLTHTNIDQSGRLQNIVIGRILEIARR
jgi:hypothetical protein